MKTRHRFHLFPFAELPANFLLFSSFYLLFHHIFNFCPFSLFCPLPIDSIQKHELIWFQGSSSCSFCLKLLIYELHLAQSLLPFNIVSLSFLFSVVLFLVATCCYACAHFLSMTLFSFVWLYKSFASISYVSVQPRNGRQPTNA